MKIKSKILGLSHTGNHYSVVLEDMTDKKVKLPVIISDTSAMEISSITGGGESFFGNLLNASETKVNEIYINDFNSGIFTVKITFENGNHFNSSVSDALTIAYSTKCEIYVSEEIFKVSGIKLKEDDTVDYSEIEYDGDDGDIELTPLEELESKLQNALENEDYEQAGRIRDEINDRS